MRRHFEQLVHLCERKGRETINGREAAARIPTVVESVEAAPQLEPLGLALAAAAAAGALALLLLGLDLRVNSVAAVLFELLQVRLQSAVKL